MTAVLVTDPKGLYDKMKQTVISLKGLEKRVDIEAFGIKDSMNDTGLTVWWVHGDAQIGNSLTKPNEPHQLNLFFSQGQRWKLVYDTKFESAKKRKAKGIHAMADQCSEDEE